MNKKLVKEAINLSQFDIISLISELSAEPLLTSPYICSVVERYHKDFVNFCERPELKGVDSCEIALEIWAFFNQCFNSFSFEEEIDLQNMVTSYLSVRSKFKEEYEVENNGESFLVWVKDFLDEQTFFYGETI